LDKTYVTDNIYRHIHLIQIVDTIWTKHEQVADKNYCHTTVHVDELHDRLAGWFSGADLITLRDAIKHMKNDLLDGPTMYYHISNDLQVVLDAVVAVAKKHASYCAKFKPDREMQNDIQCMLNDTKIKDWGHLAGDIVKIRGDAAKRLVNAANSKDSAKNRSAVIHGTLLQLLSHLEIDLDHLNQAHVTDNIAKHIHLIQIVDTIWTKHEQVAEKNYCHTTVHVDELHDNLAGWFSGDDLTTLRDAIKHMKNDLLDGPTMYYHISNDLQEVLDAVVVVANTHSSYRITTNTASTGTTVPQISAATPSRLHQVIFCVVSTALYFCLN